MFHEINRRSPAKRHQKGHVFGKEDAQNSITTVDDNTESGQHFFPRYISKMKYRMRSQIENLAWLLTEKPLD